MEQLFQINVCEVVILLATALSIRLFFRNATKGRKTILISHLVVLHVLLYGGMLYYTITSPNQMRYYRYSSGITTTLMNLFGIDYVRYEDTLPIKDLTNISFSGDDDNTFVDYKVVNQRFINQNGDTYVLNTMSTGELYSHGVCATNEQRLLMNTRTDPWYGYEKRGYGLDEPPYDYDSYEDISGDRGFDEWIGVMNSSWIASYLNYAYHPDYQGYQSLVEKDGKLHQSYCFYIDSLDNYIEYSGVFNTTDYRAESLTISCSYDSSDYLSYFSEENFRIRMSEELELVKELAREFYPAFDATARFEEVFENHSKEGRYKYDWSYHITFDGGV